MDKLITFMSIVVDQIEYSVRGEESVAKGIVDKDSNTNNQNHMQKGWC